MSESKQQAKRRHIASRRALTPRNIVALAMAECAKVVQRHRSENVTTLQTCTEYLNKVVAVNPSKE